MIHILGQVKIPKLQVERIIGPLLGMFIPEIFSTILKDDVQIICPEFPLRRIGKDGQKTNRSTNVDWLLYASGQDQLVFLELKTTDTTYDPIQHQIYRGVIELVRQSGSSFLASDVEAIMGRSLERGKYAEVLRRASDDRYRNCRKARLVYLSPKGMKGALTGGGDGEVLWLGFEDLPENIDSRFSQEWKIIRKHLIQLDGQNRRSRNRDDINGAANCFGETA
jgi:hypothetical protein